MNNGTPQRRRVDSGVSRSNPNRGTERPVQRRGHPRSQEESVPSAVSKRPVQSERRTRSQEPNQGTATRRPVQRREHQGTNNQNTGTTINSSGSTKKIASKKKKKISYETLFYISLAVYGISFFLGIFYFTNYTKSVDDYNALQESVSSLSADNEVYVSDIDRLMSRLDENKEYISTLESELGAAADDLSQVASLKEKNKEYKKKISSYKKKIESYKGKVSELEARIEAIPTPTPEPELSLEYQNALEKAKDYSEWYNYSKSMMYEELVDTDRNGFSPDAAQYAVDTLFG